MWPAGGVANLSMRPLAAGSREQRRLRARHRGLVQIDGRRQQSIAGPRAHVPGPSRVHARPWRRVGRPSRCVSKSCGARESRRQAAQDARGLPRRASSGPSREHRPADVGRQAIASGSSFGDSLGSGQRNGRLVPMPSTVGAKDRSAGPSPSPRHRRCAARCVSTHSSVGQQARRQQRQRRVLVAFDINLNCSGR